MKLVSFSSDMIAKQPSRATTVSDVCVHTPYVGLVTQDISYCSLLSSALIFHTGTTFSWIFYASYQRAALAVSHQHRFMKSLLEPSFIFQYMNVSV